MIGTAPGDSRPAGEPAEREPARQGPNQRTSDPWAHRRGEPRTFAFIWTVYLFVATVSVYAGTVSSGIGAYDAIRPAARMLLAMIGAGLFLVWPLVRFSQPPDNRPFIGPVLDLIVVLVPIQAIVWPQIAWWLTGWPVSVVAATAALLAAWAVFVAGLVSIAHQARAAGRVSGAACMAVVIVAMLLCHVPMAARAAVPAPSTGGDGLSIRSAWMFSPVAGVLELTKDTSWSGVPAQVSAGHWRLISLTAGLAVSLWLVSISWRMRRLGRTDA